MKGLASESMLLRSHLFKIPCQARHLRKGIFELKQKVGFFSFLSWEWPSDNCIVLLILTVIVLCMDSLINSFYLFLYSDVQCC